MFVFFKCLVLHLKEGAFASIGLYNKGFIYLDVPISDDSCIAGKHMLIFFYFFFNGSGHRIITLLSKTQIILGSLMLQFCKETLFSHYSLFLIFIFIVFGVHTILK